jgi:superfamily II DNA or RNA helicase
MAEVLNRYKPDSAAVVHGKTPKEERKAIFAKFAAKEIQYLLNVGIVTEGTDLPGVEVVVLARPTKSVGLYEQMIGRGVRTVIASELSEMQDIEERLQAIAFSAKPHFTVIEFEGNAGKHAIVSLPDVLAGDMTPPQRAKLRAKADESLAAGEVTDIDKALAAVRDEERRAAVASKAAVTAKTNYIINSHDPWKVYIDKLPEATDFQYKSPKFPASFKRQLEDRGVDTANMEDKRLWKIYPRLKNKPTIADLRALMALGHDGQEAATYTPERVKEILGEWEEYL